MSVQQVTTQEISNNIIAQLEISLNQTIPLLPKSFSRVLAKAIAAVFVLLYKYGGFIFLQIFVATASTRETVINGQTVVPLIEWGRLVGAGDPQPATQAELLLDVTVTNQVGQIDAGTQLVGKDNGVTYLVLNSVLLNAPIVQINARAVADQTGGDGSGAIGNLEPGSIVSFANAIANVERDTIVDSQVVTGANGESFDAYRQRVIDRFQKRPQGGAPADYELWGEEPVGIINVYPYKDGDCPGQIKVFAEATPESSGNPDGIPTNAQLQSVLDSINLDQAGLASRRSINALVNVFGITRSGFDVTVEDLDVDNPAEVQTQITDALTEYFLEREPFIFGLTVPPRSDIISATSVGAIVENIVNTSGGLFSGIILEFMASPVNQYALGEGEKAKLETITFT